MAARTRSLSVYREILKEFRRIYKQDPKNPAMRYFQDQFHKYEETTEKYCRGREEMHHMAESYLCLLQSIRKYDELSTLYAGKGERSTESAAQMVGLKLPENNNDQEKK